MRRIVCALLVLICSLCTYAQEFKVAGCYKWQLYGSCKKILDARFNGGQDSYQLNANELSYYDVRFGGIDFEVAKFKFGQGHLESVEFYSSFASASVSNAKSYRDYILEKIGDIVMYGFDVYTNDDGFKCYDLAVRFPDGYHGPHSGIILKNIGVSAEITAFRGKNKKGENKIFVGLFYEFSPWQDDDI